MNENFYVLTLSEIKQTVRAVATQLHLTFTEIAQDDNIVRNLPYYVHWEDDRHTATITIKARTPRAIDVIYHTIRDRLSQSNYTITEIYHNNENHYYCKTFAIDISFQ